MVNITHNKYYRKKYNPKSIRKRRIYNRNKNNRIDRTRRVKRTKRIKYNKRVKRTKRIKYNKRVKRTKRIKYNKRVKEFKGGTPSRLPNRRRQQADYIYDTITNNECISQGNPPQVPTDSIFSIIMGLREEKSSATGENTPWFTMNNGNDEVHDIEDMLPGYPYYFFKFLEHIKGFESPKGDETLYDKKEGGGMSRPYSSQNKWLSLFKVHQYPQISPDKRIKPGTGTKIMSSAGAVATGLVAHAAGASAAATGIGAAGALVAAAGAQKLAEYTQNSSVLDKLNIEKQWEILKKELTKCIEMQSDYSKPQVVYMCSHHHRISKLFDIGDMGNNCMVIFHRDESSIGRPLEVKVLTPTLEDPAKYKDIVEKSRHTGELGNWDVHPLRYFEKERDYDYIKEGDEVEPIHLLKDIMKELNISTLVINRHGTAVHNLLGGGRKVRKRKLVRNSRLLPGEMRENGPCMLMGKRLAIELLDKYSMDKGGCNIVWTCSDLFRSMQTLISVRNGYHQYQRQASEYPSSLLIQAQEKYYQSARKVCLKWSLCSDMRELILDRWDHYVKQGPHDRDAMKDLLIILDSYSTVMLCKSLIVGQPSETSLTDKVMSAIADQPLLENERFMRIMIDMINIGFKDKKAIFKVGKGNMKGFHSIGDRGTYSNGKSAESIRHLYEQCGARRHYLEGGGQRGGQRGGVGFTVQDDNDLWSFLYNTAYVDEGSYTVSGHISTGGISDAILSPLVVTPVGDFGKVIEECIAISKKIKDKSEVKSEGDHDGTDPYSEHEYMNSPPLSLARGKYFKFENYKEWSSFLGATKSLPDDIIAKTMKVVNNSTEAIASFISGDPPKLDLTLETRARLYTPERSLKNQRQCLFDYFRYIISNEFQLPAYRIKTLYPDYFSSGADYEIPISEADLDLMLTKINRVVGQPYQDEKDYLSIVLFYKEGIIVEQGVQGDSFKVVYSIQQQNSGKYVLVKVSETRISPPAAMKEAHTRSLYRQERAAVAGPELPEVDERVVDADLDAGAADLAAGAADLAAGAADLAAGAADLDEVAVVDWISEEPAFIKNNNKTEVINVQDPADQSTMMAVKKEQEGVVTVRITIKQFNEDVGPELTEEMGMRIKSHPNHLMIDDLNPGMKLIHISPNEPDAYIPINELDSVSLEDITEFYKNQSPTENLYLTFMDDGFHFYNVGDPVQVWAPPAAAAGFSRWYDGLVKEYVFKSGVDDVEVVWVDSDDKTLKKTVEVTSDHVKPAEIYRVGQEVKVWVIPKPVKPPTQLKYEWVNAKVTSIAQPVKTPLPLSWSKVHLISKIPTVHVKLIPEDQQSATYTINLPSTSHRLKPTQ